ncbi:receptor-type tyrosine-protein phosphatase H-like isoform X1 [Mustelus asterias]
MGPSDNCWLLLLLTLIPAWEVIGSSNCSNTIVSIVPVNTTALEVTWSNLTEDFQLINLTLRGVVRTSNESSGHVIFSGLEQGMKYNVSIQVEYVNCSSMSTQPGTTNPSPVTNLSLLNRTTNSLAINWTVPNDGRESQYTYRITVTNDTGQKVYSIGPGEHAFQVTGLQPGVLYNVTVKSVTPENTTSTPEIVTGTTNPSPVTGLSLLNRTTNSLAINWTVPMDSGASQYTYRITVSSDTEASTKVYSTGPGEHAFQVTGLKPGVQYNLTVKSVTPENTTSTPEIVTGTTNPSPVTGLSLLNRTTESLAINWMVPADLKASQYTYNITVTSDFGLPTKTDSTGPGEHAFQVTGLQPGVPYNVTVKSVTPENTMSAPEVVTDTTNPSVVTGLSLVNRTTESLVIAWTPPNDTRVLEYTYNITVTNDTGTVTYATETGEKEFIVTGLKPGINYNLTVESVTPENTVSDPENMNTNTNPSPVRSLSVLSRTTDSLVINWTDPEDQRVREYTYNITVTSDTGAFIAAYATPRGQNKFNMTGLQPGVRYNLIVQSLTPENTLSAPENMKGTTNPSLVTNLSVLSRTRESLVIKWTAPNNSRVDEYTYNVTVTNDTGALNESSSTLIGLNEFQVTGLNPGIKYHLTVQSVTPEDTQSDPNKIEGTTNPSPVTDLTLTNRTANTLTLRWNASHDIRASDYTYKVNVENSNLTATKTTPPGMTQIQMGSLVPGVQYKLRVESVTPENTTSVAQSLRAATVPGTVFNIQCAWVTGYKILVEWSNPMGNFTGFNIAVYDGTHLQSTQTISEDKDTVIINSLQPARKYTVHVETQTGHDYSEGVPVHCQTNSTPIIIGAVIGSFLGLILIGFLLYFILTKRVPWTKQPTSDFAPMTAIPKEVKPIPVRQYEGYFQSKHADTDFGFAEEYQSLSMVGTGQSVSAAQQMENKGKNRYTNVLPYDASRVKLVPQPENFVSDYINANYMPCYRTGSEFIAAQGPLPSTVADFWRMVWEQGSEVIVMLTNCVELNRVKCEHYWPLDYTPCTYEDITVTVTQETILNEWTLRDFRIKRAGSSEQRLVTHFHFTAWPDHGVPKTTDKLLAFHQLIRDRLNRNQQGPPVIHCSAGVGRTGTLIALDYLLQQIEHEDVIDVYGIVHKMRCNRPLMVQTEPQYVFLHQCMLDRIQSKQPQEAIYQNQQELQTEQDLIYENVSAIKTSDRLV